MAAAKNLVARWVREQVKDQEGVHLPELTDRAVAYFMEDRDFVARFLAEHFRDVVYFVAQQVVAETRKGGTDTALVLRGDDLLTGKRLRRELLKRPRWRDWLEFTGERHVLVAAMTRRELLAAADIRQGRGIHELRMADCWRRLADGLVGDQTVGEVYDEAALAALLNNTLEGTDDDTGQ